MNTLWRGVERLAQAGLILGLAVMLLASLAQVIARYVFAQPFSWSEELVRLVFIWVSYLSAWLAWKHRAHIALDAVQYVPWPVVGLMSASLVEVAVLGLCLYTFWTNAGLIRIAANQPTPMLGVPMGWVYAGYSAMAALIAGDIVVGWLRRDPPPAFEGEGTA